MYHELPSYKPNASDSQKKANLKGASNIDIAVIEEAEDIRDVDKFNTFKDSLRKQGCIVIIILNTPDLGHWIVSRYFNTKEVYGTDGEIVDGYFEIIPKSIPGFLCIQTSFEDNPYLPSSTVSDYKGYGDPESHLYNLHYYLTSIKGYTSTGRKGQILKKVKSITLADYLALPFKEHYGQDFGTSSPAGLVGVKIDSNNCWARELNYSGMNVLDIGKLYCQMQLNDTDVVIADSAEPQSIGKLRNGWQAEELPADVLELYPQLLKGFNIFGQIKGPGSIKSGLDKMDTMNLYAVEESKNLWVEVRSYIGAVDKNGNPTGEPIDGFNHLIDPWRGVITSRGRYF